MKLKDKVAIITGGCRGIGKSLAEAFSHEGAQVVIAAEIKEELAQVAEELGVDHLKTDVTEINEVEKLVEHTVSRYKKIDILINAAGMQVPIDVITGQPFLPVYEGQRTALDVTSEEDIYDAFLNRYADDPYYAATPASLAQ